MKQIILEKIAEIEQVENVQILLAIESGSRAWGFASPDSDYDVRFIYKRPITEYLRLDKRRDVIEFMLDDTLDINGWDLDKTLRLLYSSNPTLFEWCNSPIIYKTSDFHEELKTLLPTYFLSKACLYHYLSMAKRNFSEHLKTDTVKLKKYLYAIRPLLACRWILANKSAPPMLFSDLVESQLESDMLPFIDELLKNKIKTPERLESKRIEPINEWLEKNLVVLKQQIQQLPSDEKISWDKMHELFFHTLNISK